MTAALVVTFTNSAVANFRSRIGSFLRQGRGLLPPALYRVRTRMGWHTTLCANVLVWWG